jgi:hypothetical protein
VKSDLYKKRIEQVNQYARGMMQRVIKGQVPLERYGIQNPEKLAPEDWLNLLLTTLRKYFKKNSQQRLSSPTFFRLQFPDDKHPRQLDSSALQSFMELVAV